MALLAAGGGGCLFARCCWHADDCKGRNPALRSRVQRESESSLILRLQFY